jgi:hypothetical protein
MFGDLRRYPWVLDTVRYQNAAELITILREKVITQAEAAVRRQTPAIGAPFSVVRPRSRSVHTLK